MADNKKVSELTFPNKDDKTSTTYDIDAKFLGGKTPEDFVLSEQFKFMTEKEIDDLFKKNLKSF